MKLRKKLPCLVIVGRPNVGKSSLFNRIIGKRVAVVEAKPGITRDRLYQTAEWGGKTFEIVDTGGILFTDDDPLSDQIRIQAEVALEEADVVLFMVDAQEGINPADEELADALRKVKKPIIVVVNKADHPKHDTSITDFFRLGFKDVMPVSAVHGRGLTDILDRTVHFLPESEKVKEEVDEPVKISIVGRPNVGKSSLLNAFTGEQRAIVSAIPGTTRDAINTEIQYKEHRITLVDTAGLRRPGKVQGSVEYYMALRAKKAIERSDVALVVIDGSEGILDGDKRIAKLAHDEGRACVFLVNKWDLVEPPDGKPKKRTVEKKRFAEKIHRDLAEMAYVPICFGSAIAKSGLEAVLETCLESAENHQFRIPTVTLNRIIRESLFERPYSRRGKSFKVYYATQTGTAPPRFLLFCNDPNLVSTALERFLEKRIRKEYSLEGTPINLHFRSSHEKEAVRVSAKVNENND